MPNRGNNQLEFDVLNRFNILRNQILNFIFKFVIYKF